MQNATVLMTVTYPFSVTGLSSVLRERVGQDSLVRFRSAFRFDHTVPFCYHEGKTKNSPKLLSDRG